MVMTDPIADFLTRIRNANMVMHEKVEIPASKTKIALAEILKNEGFIKDYEQVEDGKQGIIRVYLKYGPNRKSYFWLETYQQTGLESILQKR